MKFVKIASALVLTVATPALAGQQFTEAQIREGYRLYHRSDDMVPVMGSLNRCGLITPAEYANYLEVKRRSDVPLDDLLDSDRTTERWIVNAKATSALRRQLMDKGIEKLGGGTC